MSIPTPPPTDPYARFAAPAPTGKPPRLRRRVIALIAAGGLLVGAAGVSTAAVSSSALADRGTASSQTWMSGRGTADGSGSSDSGTGTGGDGWGDGTAQAPGWGQGSEGSSGDGSSDSSDSGRSSVDSDPATAAESEGVALIDTVLTNGEAAGTGIVLTSDGEVLTNYHVVEGSTSIRVTIASTGKTYSATVVGADETADVALVKLAGASGLTVSTIDDDTLAVGDDVTAIGNAGGTGTLTAADGDVTDLASEITTESEQSVQGETLEGLIETDADVVAGDSGGPLVDAEGEVVGIDTAASSGQDIDGYAIPIDDALAIVTQILDGEETTAVRIGPAAFLGVELGSTTGGYADGATIAGTVEDGAADRAGLAAGDTVTAIGSTSVTDASALSAAIAKLQPGDETKLTWTTADGDTESATVTLGSSPVA